MLTVPRAQVLTQTAARLCERRTEAHIVPFRSDSRLRPVRNQCHQNCNDRLGLYPNHRIVRGWLVLDYRDVYGHGGYRFFAHSIMEDEKGNRFDVTTTPWYPFLEIEGHEGDFIMLVQQYNLGAIDHYLGRSPSA
jgi:hypothetical protein